MADAQPVLQIVHITDLHLVAPTARTFAARLRLLRRYMPQRWRRFIESRSAPHDPAALRKFREFMHELNSHRSAWTGVTTWLIDTGDLTVYGDRDSLTEGWTWHRNAGIRASSGTSLALHGNHDAWPGDFPLFAKDSAIQAQRRRLRSVYPTLPSQPLRVIIPGAGDGAVIELWALNSVACDRMLNAWAYGVLKNDDPPGPPGSAIHEMAKRIRQRGKVRTFRILATHHPIHYPPPEPALTMTLANSEGVAADISSPDYSDVGSPLAHLVISGHTHEVYPPFGSLPIKSDHTTHPPLARGTCQLIGGTLSQQDFDGKRWPHQFELLRFYFDRERQSELILERVIVGREEGIGNFRIRENSKTGIAEEMLFQF